MSDMDRDYVEEFLSVGQAFVDSLNDASEQELCQDVRDEVGTTPEKTAAHVRDLLLATSRDFFRTQRLNLAHQIREAPEFSTSAKLPPTDAERKSLLERILNLMPSLGPQLTLAYRDYRDLPPEDVTTALEALDGLGFLEQFLEEEEPEE